MLGYVMVARRVGGKLLLLQKERPRARECADLCGWVALVVCEACVFNS